MGPKKVTILLMFLGHTFLTIYLTYLTIYFTKKFEFYYFFTQIIYELRHAAKTLKIKGNCWPKSEGRSIEHQEGNISKTRNFWNFKGSQKGRSKSGKLKSTFKY